jgi:arsenate reductase
MKIYHNPRCAKSRHALTELQHCKVDVEVVDYQLNPMSKIELQALVQLLALKPSQIVRKGEELYKTAFKDKQISEDEWLDILVQYPKLIERPIIVNGNKAIIGRDAIELTKFLVL